VNDNAEGERQRRGDRGLPRVGQVMGVDAQLGVQVRAERIVLGELDGDLSGGRLGQPLRPVQRGQLGEFLLR
jgi:hypothetical protein